MYPLCPCQRMTFLVVVVVGMVQVYVIVAGMVMVFAGVRSDGDRAGVRAGGDGSQGGVNSCATGGWDGAGVSGGVG